MKSIACWMGCLALMAMLAGCGGGGDSPSPSVDVSGHWTGRSSVGIGFTMDLTQTGASVSGSSTAGGETGQTVGSVDGNTFSFSIVWPASGTGTGQATVEGNTMSGTEQEAGGSGTFTATRH